MPSASPISAPPASTGSHGDCMKGCLEVMNRFSVAADIPILQACIRLECRPMAY
jgi:hypothetical protein